MEKGKVQTVLGYIDPNDLGLTFCHEHLSMLYEVAYTPAKECDKHKETTSFAMENLGWIRQNPYSHKENLQLLDVDDAVLDDVKLFKQNGGGTLVENSTVGLSRNINFVQKVAKETGVNVVAGTGYYVGPSLSAEVKSLSLEAMVREMTTDLTEGVSGTGIKCGVIGEIGCMWPLQDVERRALQASAAVQADLGCPLIIHPGRNKDAPAEIVRIVQEAGGDISKTVMSHLDRTIHTKEDLLEFAKLGSYLEYDLFGIECSHYQMDRNVDMPSDAQRIERINWLLQEGYENRVLIAHDVHTRHRLVKFGGHGFSHILENIVPKMLERGISQKTIDTILIENPKCWLTI